MTTRYEQKAKRLRAASARTEMALQELPDNTPDVFDSGEPSSVRVVRDNSSPAGFAATSTYAHSSTRTELGSKTTNRVPSQQMKKGSALVFCDYEHHINIFQGDCIELLEKSAASHPDGCVDVIFADPPYFLSNGGITCHSGRMVSVDKGDWDKSPGPEQMHQFNLRWLSLCQRLLKPNGTIWVSGTSHVIYSIGFAMQQLDFKLLNDVAWVKPNPPPNLSCRYFTHATETILWAAKNAKSKHLFNYKLMRELAGGKQMKNVWELLPPNREEKTFGKHSTQKPTPLLERILIASSQCGDLVLDPFLGSGTTGVAAVRLNRKFVGIELLPEYVDLAVKRIRHEIDIKKSEK